MLLILFTHCALAEGLNQPPFTCLDTKGRDILQQGEWFGELEDENEDTADLLRRYWFSEREYVALLSDVYQAVTKRFKFSCYHCFEYAVNEDQCAPCVAFFRREDSCQLEKISCERTLLTTMNELALWQAAADKAVAAIQEAWEDPNYF